MENRAQGNCRLFGGFTLIEMALVLAIVSLLLAVLLKGGAGFLDNGKQVATEAKLSQIGTALLAYEGENLRLPTQEQGLRALSSKPESAPVPRSWRRYMRSVPSDPWGNPFVYRIPAQRDRNDPYDLFSSGEDGIPDTEDDIHHWDEEGI